MIFIYFSLYANAQMGPIPTIGSRYLPSYAVNSFLAAAVIIIGLAVLGYVAAMTESTTATEAYGLMTATLSVLMGAYAIILYINSGKMMTYYSNNWGDLMLY